MASAFTITLDTTSPGAAAVVEFDASAETLDAQVTLTEPGSIVSSTYQDSTNGVQVALQVEGSHVYGPLVGGAWVPGWLHLTVQDVVGNQGVVSQYVEPAGVTARVRRFWGRLRTSGGNKRQEMTAGDQPDRTQNAPKD